MFFFRQRFQTSYICLFNNKFWIFVKSKVIYSGILTTFRVLLDLWYRFVKRPCTTTVSGTIFLYFISLKKVSKKSCLTKTLSNCPIQLKKLQFRTIFFLIQAFLDFWGFVFCDFWFNTVHNSILFSSPLVLLSNLNLRGFCIPCFLCVPTLTVRSFN